MYKLFAFFLVALLVNESMAMTFRLKRQSADRNNTVAAPAETGARQASLSQEEIQACIRSCPVTAEYNPVCGSNRMTYSNPGRLLCAQGCGVNVNQLRSSPCPPS